MAALAAMTLALSGSVRAANPDDLPSGPAAPILRVGDRLPARLRTPAFPPKQARTLYSDAQLRQLHANVAERPPARATADRIVREADYWLGWTDEALRDLVTSAEVPRAFDCSPAGCPVHGKKIFEAASSTYPWITDPKMPFKVKCPIGGELYPSNDYGRFYRSGFTDRSDFNGPYVDDGRGWLAPDGQRYWFVAYANHWTWHQTLNRPHNVFGACESLSRAYLITGDRRFAHKAAVLVRRIAEVYPAMDYETQSRYGEMMRATGEQYPGKVVNSIWECQLVAQFAATYDAVWETIDGDRELQRLYGQSGSELRACIEANLLEEGIDAYYRRTVHGNYGMHQRALLVLAIVRQTGDNARYLADIVDRPFGKGCLGLKYALTNLVWCDGQPNESPGYNRLWLRNVAGIAELLPRLGRDLGTLPRVQRLFASPLEATVIGAYTPAIGDSFSVYGGLEADEPTSYRTAYRLYGDPAFAEPLAADRPGGRREFATFESLLEAPLPADTAAHPAGRRFPARPSRLLSGYGLSILNNASDTAAATLYHGMHVSHAHYDRLNLEVFANGEPMLPDLGYGDAMNTFVSSIYTWTKNTVAHNTVVVDAVHQIGNEPGVLELQTAGDWARACIASAPGTYPQCDVYRRSIVMVDLGPDHSYVVDVFAVRGGRQHDYSLHGPPGTFTLVDGEWSGPARGTLAGEDVPLGKIYDDPVLGAPAYTGGYAGYAGSGFQHLTDVRRLERGAGVVMYTHEKNPHARLALRVLPQAGQQVLFAQARVSPVKYPQRVGFVIARNVASGARKEPLTSRFVSVLEPFAQDAVIESATRHDEDGVVVITVRRRDGETDIVVVSDTATEHRARVLGHEVVTTGRIAVVRFAVDGKRCERAWTSGPGRVAVDGAEVMGASTWQTQVASVDPARNTVRLKCVGPRPADPALLKGVVAYFGAGARTGNAIDAATYAGDLLEVRLHDDLVVGLANVVAVSARNITTRAGLVFAPTYKGATLLAGDGTVVGQVAAATETTLETRGPLASGAVHPGDDVRILSVGPGDPCAFSISPAP